MMYLDITAEKEEPYYNQKFAPWPLILFHTACATKTYRSCPKFNKSVIVQIRGIILETSNEFLLRTDVTLLFGCINYLPTTSLT